MIDISLSGSTYPVPSSPADTNWQADQVAWEQAVSTAANYAVRQLHVNVTPVGNGADTTEDNLMTYSLPAGTLSANGMGVRVTAAGVGVNTADATTVRCYFGAALMGTLILEPSQVNNWRATFEMFRTGASAQAGCSVITDSGGAVADLTQTTANTATETLSGAVTIKFTGQRATTPTANSVQQLYMTVELLPRVP